MKATKTPSTQRKPEGGGGGDEQCFKCKNAFQPSDEIIEALGHVYCDACFVCDSCNGSLEEGFARGRENAPVCMECAKTSTVDVVEEIEAKLEASQQAQQNLQNELQQVRQEKLLLEQKISAETQKLVSVEEALKASETRIAEQTSRTSELEAKLKIAEEKAAQLDAATAQQQTLEQQVKEAQQKTAELAKQLEEAQQKQGAEHEQLKEQNAANAQAQLEKDAQHRSEVERLELQVKELTNEVEALKNASSSSSFDAGANEAYVAQLEADLQAAKLNLMAANENYEQLSQQSATAIEKANQYDGLLEKMQEMGKILDALQEENTSLQEKLQTSESQCVALSALLGKAKSAAAAVAAPVVQEDSEELKTLRSKVQTLEAHVHKQELQMQTLRGLHQLKATESSSNVNNNNNNNSDNNSANAAAPVSASASAASAEPDPISVADFDDALAPNFGTLNTQSKERKKERTTFLDRKYFNDPKGLIVGAGHAILFVRDNVKNQVLGTFALFKQPTAVEIKYVAFASDAMEQSFFPLIVTSAELWAKKWALNSVSFQFSGTSDDANKKFGEFGFKNAGVGPAPDFSIKMEKAVAK